MPSRSFGPVPGLVWAFRFAADGRPTPIDAGDTIEFDGTGWLWIHINLADARARNWVTASHLPEQAQATLLSADGFQQMHSSERCVCGVFADFVREIDRPSQSQLGFLHFAMLEGLLISGRHHPLTALEATRKVIEEGHVPANVACLLELIVERVALGIEDAAEKLSTDLDQFEETLLTSVPEDYRSRLGRARRASVRIHRQISGMRTSFQRLEREDTKLKPQLRLAASRLAQRLDGIDHDIVAIRDRAYLLQEEAADKLSEETNRHLRILTGVTTLLLPATFVTGV